MLFSVEKGLNRPFIYGFIAACAVAIIAFLSLGLSWQKAFFGVFYFMLTPFLAIPAFPVSIVVLVILLLLFRRVGSCMRPQWQWIAYTLLFLHWEAWGFYCSSYVTH